MSQIKRGGHLALLDSVREARAFPAFEKFQILCLILRASPAFFFFFLFPYLFVRTLFTQS